MTYEINYEEKQMGIIKKSIPILIQQIKNGNPFRPRFQESQMNYRFFRKSVYNLWNIVTDEDLDMEYEDEAVWADMFVDQLMDINNNNKSNNNSCIAVKEQKHQPGEQEQQSTEHKDTMRGSMAEPSINEMETFINFATSNGFLDMESELIRNSLTPKDLNATEVKVEMNITEMNKAEMNITEMNKAEVNITEMNKAEMNKAEMNKAEMNITEMNITDTKTTERNITGERRKKWTLARVFGIIFPCFRPKAAE